MIGLLLSLVSMLGVRKIRQKEATKYHVQLCISMLLTLIFFLVGVGGVQVKGLCIAISVLTQYTILVSFMWMGAEAVFMFQKLVIVFSNVTKKFVVILSLICWTVPIVFVIVPLGVNPDSMITCTFTELNPCTGELIPTEEMNCREDNIIVCFAGDIAVLYGSLLGPILAVLLFNLVIFVCVVVVLTKHTLKKYKCAKLENSRSVIIRFLFSIFGLVTLYGFPWIFAFTTAFTNNDAAFAFEVIFSVIISLQGFFMFLFFCVIGKDSRDAWKEALCRDRVARKSLHETSRSSKYGTNSRSKNTGSTLVRQTGTSTLECQLARQNSNLSDSTSTMGTLERRVFGHRSEPETSSVVGTLNRRTIFIPPDINELPEYPQDPHRNHPDDVFVNIGAEAESNVEIDYNLEPSTTGNIAEENESPPDYEAAIATPADDESVNNSVLITNPAFTHL